MTNTILITGANRGLGLEFTKQYAKENNIIHACCRNPKEATELQALQKAYPLIKIHKLDVTSERDILALATEITDPIDILINNAGVLENDPSFGELSVEYLTRTFLINAVAPIKMTEAFIPHLTQGKQKLIVCLSSRVGSISDNTSGGYYSYRAGKAALNMLMKSAAIDLENEDIKILLLHPGWVKTRMGGEGATLTPEESIKGLRNVINNYAPSPGEVKFLNYKGEEIPW